MALRQVTKEELDRLREMARILRCDVIRMVHASGSGHPGGSLSAADIMAALYFHFLRVDPGNPLAPDRDRFILSKGHCCPVHYAALARRGFFPVAELLTLRRLGSVCQGHPCMKKTPGLDMTSGSLGNGLSIGAGMALGARLDGRTYRVFVMVGDGEMQEGMIWEALMSSAHLQLGNLCLIVDKNGLQVDGPVAEIVSIDPLPEKLRDFGWEVREIDGHDMGAIVDTLDAVPFVAGKPSMIIAHTIKGKGFKPAEDRVDWHYQPVNKEILEAALAELRAAMEGRR